MMVIYKEQWGQYTEHNREVNYAEWTETEHAKLQSVQLTALWWQQAS